MSFVSAVIPAAGYGRRMKKVFPKTLILLDKRPIFIHTLEVISGHPRIKEIILVAPSQYLGVFERKVKLFHIRKVKAIVKGGMRRQDSVRVGLSYIDRKTDLVLIHDAVRPFINLKMITNLLSLAKRYKAVSVGIPVTATLKRVDRNQFIEETLRRNSLWETHTPQVFRKEVIQEAHRRFKDILFSDDASMVEKLGVRVKIIRGSIFNIKITYPEDLLLAEAILKYKKRYGL